MSDSPIIHDVQNIVLRDNDENNFTIQHTQHIDQSFLDNLRDARENSLGQDEAEYMSVASIPVAIHEQWLREGFDLMNEPAHAIVARLKQHNLDAFLTTKKQV
jgi:hypothetical protein|tara:strand:+ start:6876 stop:7184 length:309 start_codon:yes stop_codon:yes gene_type:complete